MPFLGHSQEPDWSCLILEYSFQTILPLSLKVKEPAEGQVEGAAEADRADFRRLGSGALSPEQGP